MALRKMGIYNDVSPELFPKLPARGTKVTYRFLETYLDPFSDDGIPVYKATLLIPPMSRTFDPIKSDWVEVGMIGGLDMFGNPESRTIRREWVKPQDNGGLLTLTIGNSKDDELYQYLELASFNAANPNRDNSVKPILERVDYEAEARQARNEIKSKLEAVKRASMIESKDLHRYASILGFSIEDTDEEIRFNIENFAHEEPSEFLNRMNDELFEIESYCSLALDKKIVYISKDDNRLKWSDTKGEIVKLTSLDEGSAISAYGNFVTTNKVGKEIHNELVRLVDGAGTGVKKPMPKK